MAEPVRDTSHPVPSTVGADRPRVVLVIEAMSEEQVALLVEDLVEVLARRGGRQPSEVAS
jgi:hypothetical protein